MRKFITEQLNKRALSTDERDAIVFFEGMLKGTQLRLTGRKQTARAKLADLGLLDETGNPKLPDA